MNPLITFLAPKIIGNLVSSISRHCPCPCEQSSSSSTEATPTDHSQISSSSNQLEKGFTKVTVEKWSEANQGGPTRKNDSISNILLNQGYSMDEILQKDENGKTLIDQVVKANPKIKNPNIIHPDWELRVPTKLAPEEDCGCENYPDGNGGLFLDDQPYEGDEGRPFCPGTQADPYLDLSQTFAVPDNTRVEILTPIAN